MNARLDSPRQVESASGDHQFEPGEGVAAVDESFSGPARHANDKIATREQTSS
jgi:hypothetical protein